MLVKILGAIDLIAGLVLLFGAGLKLPQTLLLVFGIVLIAKSVLGLLKELGSWIDLSAGIVLILSSLFAMPVAISIICAVLVLQKGFFSFLG